MKSIKKISLVALAAILSISFASAQVGIQAGYSSAKGNDKNAEALNGFHVGPIYNMAIQGPISLQYGLLYNFNTHKESVTALGVTSSASSTMHSLDIPVRVAASFPIASGLSAFVFGGPNFNIGLVHNATGKVGGIEKTIKLYDDKDYSRFNLQLGLGAGLQYNNMGVKFGYDFGMLNLYKDADPAVKVNGMKVGLFYNF